MIHSRMKKKGRLEMSQTQGRLVKDSIKFFLGSSLVQTQIGKKSKEARAHFLKDVLDIKFLESDILS